MVDDFYDRNQEEEILKELDYLERYCVKDKIPIGSSEENPAILSRLALDYFYRGQRDKSSILRHHGRVCSLPVVEQYQKTTPSWRTWLSCNIDQSIVSYYENQDEYKTHFDTFMHTCLIWFYREPKRFTGGDLKFPQSDSIVECKHNRMVIFPSYYLHEVDMVSMDQENVGKGYGRWCITHFYTHQPKIN